MTNITIKVHYDEYQWDFVTVDNQIKVLDLFLQLYLENPNFYNVFILGTFTDGKFLSFDPLLSLSECCLVDDSLVHTTRICSEPQSIHMIDTHIKNMDSKLLLV